MMHEITERRCTAIVGRCEDKLYEYEEAFVTMMDELSRVIIGGDLMDYYFEMMGNRLDWEGEVRDFFKQKGLSWSWDDVIKYIEFDAIRIRQEALQFHGCGGHCSGCNRCYCVGY